MAEEKKEKKCNCLLVLGIIILALGLLADVLGIGGGDGFGIKQILVVVVGAVLTMVGLKTSKFCKCCKK